MGYSAAADVQFDWDGSLASARRLWALAADVSTLMTSRETLGGDAVTDLWQGPHAVSFGERLGTERLDADAISEQLRIGALGWAEAWKEAMNEQNRILHVRECQRRKDNAEWYQSGLLGSVFGGPDLPNEPELLSAPVAPNFFPTGGFVSY